MPALSCLRGLDHFGAQVDTGHDGAARCDTACRPACACRDVENALTRLRIECVDGVLDGVGDSSADFIIFLAPSAPGAGGLDVGWEDGGVGGRGLVFGGHGGLLLW